LDGVKTAKEETTSADDRVLILPHSPAPPGGDPPDARNGAAQPSWVHSTQNTSD
jgi:hypothetical protein